MQNINLFIKLSIFILIFQSKHIVLYLHAIKKTNVSKSFKIEYTYKHCIRGLFCFQRPMDHEKYKSKEKNVYVLLKVMYRHGYFSTY